MEKKNLKGQVLSEKEMREVKGGETFSTKGSKEAICCPHCEASENYLENTSKTIDDKGNILGREYRCTACGSIIVL